MNKLKEHLTNNLAIYLIIIATIVIFLIIKFVPHEEETKYDTSLFNVVDLKGANELFKDNINKVLIIGREDCNACQNFLPTLKYAMIKYSFNVSYIELDNINPKNEGYDEFINNIDYTYTLKEKTDKFSTFLGVTPMVIIIKNNKMVYGYIGSMSEETIGAIVTQYGITNNVS